MFTFDRKPPSPAARSKASIGPKPASRRDAEAEANRPAPPPGASFYLALATGMPPAHDLTHAIRQSSEGIPPSSRPRSPGVEIRLHARAPLIQREVDPSEPDERLRRGLPLPYREATQFAECLQSGNNRDYCNRTVLGITPPEPERDAATQPAQPPAPTQAAATQPAQPPAWALGPWRDTDDQGHPRQRQTPPGYGLDRRWYDPRVPVVTGGGEIPGNLPRGTRGRHDDLRWAFYGDEISVQQRIPWSQLAITFDEAAELDRRERERDRRRRLRRVRLRDAAAARDSEGAGVESNNGVVHIAGFDREGVIVGDPGWLHHNRGELRGGARSRGNAARARFRGALGVGEGNSVVFGSEAEGMEAIRRAIRSGGREQFVRRMCRWDDPHGQCNPWDLNQTAPLPAGRSRRQPAYVEPARRILRSHNLPGDASCLALPPEVVEEMADFVARNETPGHGHAYRRGDQAAPPWVRETFERSPAEGAP